MITTSWGFVMFVWTCGTIFCLCSQSVRQKAGIRSLWGYFACSLIWPVLYLIWCYEVSKEANIGISEKTDTSEPKK